MAEHTPGNQSSRSGLDERLARRVAGLDVMVAVFALAELLQGANPDFETLPVYHGLGRWSLRSVRTSVGV
jgi:hypothetical protein